ncbi:MAG: MBL fold metallo-hydrolase [Planctomycetes bacterium]|nr:MBL fold metallo-hydrolase [Planctomycetota bacterium]
MIHHICATCGTQYPATERPPKDCVICEDDRQYVGWKGQRWTSAAELALRHRVLVEDDDGVLGLSVTPDLAIDQRACLIPGARGNVLWEALPMVDAEALAALRARGGVALIAISHPHFYSSMVDWSEALGGVPILLHEADRRFVMRPHPAIEFWSGDRLDVASDLSLIRCGGHFAGSTALHWRRGPRPGGALFTGDALQVGLGRRQVAFMYSYPNLVPMNTSAIESMRDRLAALDFEDVFGYARGRNIIGGARAAVDQSFARHLEAVRG